MPRSEAIEMAGLGIRQQYQSGATVDKIKPDYTAIRPHLHEILFRFLHQLSEREFQHYQGFRKRQEDAKDFQVVSPQVGGVG
jgi:hypothetical protein